MTEKRFTYLDASKNHYIGSFFCNGVPLTNKEVVDLLNENELKTAYDKLQEENKLLKEKLNEILELTELTGMIHLRKAEIKSIIKR